MNRSYWKSAWIILCTFIVIGVLAGCGEKEETPEIVGAWKAVLIEVSGVAVDMEQYSEQLGISTDDIKMDINVQEDNTFSFDFLGQKTDGTWEETDGKYILISEGQKQKALITDGKLTFEEETTGAKVTFKKK